MTIEEDLRRTLRYAASQVQPDPRAAAPTGRPLVVRRSGRWTTAALVATAAVILAAVTVVVGSDDRSQRVETGPAVSAPPPAQEAEHADAGFAGIWPEWGFDDYARTSAEVAAGSRRWRLDPVSVARAYLAERLDLRSVSLGPFEAFDANRGQVAYRAGVSSGAVVLDRPGGERSPYVVAESSSEGLTAAPVGAGSTRGVTPAGALRDPLVLEVWSSTRGRGTARAGRLPSEWTTEASFAVSQSDTERVKLGIDAPLPEAMLVRVEVLGEDGRARVAEFRVDAPHSSTGAAGEGRTLAAGEFVALSSVGAFVVSVGSGEIVTEVAGEHELGEGASGLTVSPDRTTVLFSRARTGCTSEIVSVRLAGGGATVLAAGTWPALSPDGRRLAYASDPDCTHRSQIIVRDMATGEGRVWKAERGAGDDLPALVRSLSWSPEGGRVAFELVHEDGSEIRVLDVARGEHVSDSTRLRPPDGASWASPAFDRGGNLVVVEAREGDDSLAVVVARPATGRSVARVSAGVGRLFDLAVTQSHDEVLAVAVDGPIHEVRRGRRIPNRHNFSEAAW